MSFRWNLDKGKFVSAGTRKINDRKVYAVEYFPNVGSQEFSVKPFFDAENYHHIRTEYQHTIADKENKFGTFGVQSGTKLALTEEFDNFKTKDGMTLPYNYKIKYSTESNYGVYEYNWTVDLAEYYFNRNLDSKFFTFEGN